MANPDQADANNDGIGHACVVKLTAVDDHTAADGLRHHRTDRLPLVCVAERHNKPLTYAACKTG